MLPKLKNQLSQEQNIEIVGYNMKSIMSIASCIDDDEDFAKFNGTPMLLLTKLKYLLEQGEEDKLTSVIFNLLDNLDPNYTANTIKL